MKRYTAFKIMIQDPDGLGRPCQLGFTHTTLKSAEGAARRAYDFDGFLVWDNELEEWTDSDELAERHSEDEGEQDDPDGDEVSARSRARLIRGHGGADYNDSLE